MSQAPIAELTFPKRVPHGKIDKSKLLIADPVRERGSAHLAYVAAQRCCIPGCPARANVHHLGHVQPKARALKAGNQWTVPLCQAHHQGSNGVHASDAAHAMPEAAWWKLRGVDPVKLAARLWAESQALRKVAA